MKKCFSFLSQVGAWSLRQKILVTVGFFTFVSLAFIFSWKRNEARQKIDQETPGVSRPSSVTTKVTEPSWGSAQFLELPDGSQIPIGKGSGVTGVTPIPLTAVRKPSVSLPMTVYRDAFLGFSIRIPEMWHLHAMQGKILVKREPQALTGVVVYPVFLKKGLTLTEFLRSCFQIDQAIYQKSGNSLSLGAVDERETLATADFSGVLAGIPIQGKAKVSLEGRRGLYRAYWARQKEWEGLEEMLQVIAESFETFQGEPLKLYQGNAFQVYYPDGWQVSETLNGIDVKDPQDETAVSIGLSIYLPGNPDPFQFMDFALRNLGDKLQNSVILDQKSYADMTDAIGQTWRMGGRIMEYDWQGRRLRAAMTSGILRQMVSFSGVMSIRQAPLERWESVSSLLEAIEKSFQVLHPELLGGGVKGMVLPANHPADTSSVMESWEAKTQSNDLVGEKWGEYMQGGGYRDSEKTGQAVWVTPQDYDPTRGGYVNPQDPTDIILE
ncbi:MAG: hypothetical protein HYS08_02605 [Chlamydiae bacterium]|nr:hypothetical protein [Chlamydiota bacterium]MBI3266621.1 hypothetical protein [Chlamydiota bacterium]